MEELKLWYKKPSEEWTDSLPLGNGRIGAMVFGGIKNERIGLNEDTLWSGYPLDKNNHDSFKYLEEARKLAGEGKYDELGSFIEANMLGDYTESYLPLGDLFINFSNIDETEVSDYYRELSLNKAMTLTRFSYRGVKHFREAFVSKEANAFIMRIYADKAGEISLKLSFDSQLKYELEIKDNSLCVEGLCPSHVEPSYLYSENPIIYLEDDDKKGIRFNGLVRIDNKGGNIKAEEGSILVDSADEVIISFMVRTSFNGYDKQPYIQGQDYKSNVEADLEYLNTMTYESVLQRHLSDFKALYERVDFYLENDNKKDIPTDQRLEEFALDKTDKDLYRLLFQYGRYLLISSSMEGCQPANLQGIWNQELRAPWSSNFTLNINTEMNYWLAESCNLSECHKPLFELIKNLGVMGEKTAKLHYNASGAVSHHNSDIWCITNPVGRHDKYAVGYAFWPMSFGWLCRHLYEHYEYSLNKEFLEKEAYPLIKKAAQFYLDVLVDDGNGNLIISPCTSPENAFIKDGQVVRISKTATMSTAIVKEVFNNVLIACKILECDEEFCEKVRASLDKLPSYKIGKRGNFMEWDEDYEDSEETHRHISHLYPFYPGNEITKENNPAFTKAIEKTLEIRGDGGTGWSLGWKVNCFARLKDGNHAEKLLQNQLNFVKTNECDYSNGGGTYRNMFDAHPPFQIDGNFAASAGIAEMMLQNEDGCILLLPALPDSWKSGYIKGLKAKGQAMVDIYFKDGKLEKAFVYNTYPGKKEFKVKYQDKEWSFELGMGEQFEL